jgi:hypothetical protein
VGFVSLVASDPLGSLAGDEGSDDPRGDACLGCSHRAPVSAVVRPYVQVFDDLEEWLIPRHIGMRHQEHKIFAEWLEPCRPARSGRGPPKDFRSSWWGRPNDVLGLSRDQRPRLQRAERRVIPHTSRANVMLHKMRTIASRLRATSSAFDRMSRGRTTRSASFRETASLDGRFMIRACKSESEALGNTGAPARVLPPSQRSRRPGCLVLESLT